MANAPPGLKVEPTHRGFVVTLRAGVSTSGVGVFVGLAVTVVGVGLCGWLGTDAPKVALLSVVPAIVGAVLTLGFLAVRRARMNAGAGRLEYDGARVRFLGVEGPADIPIDAVKGVDLVPVGLALRVHGGGAWHFPLHKVPPEGRAWLRDQLRAASARHGRPEDVPDAIKGLGPRAREPGGESS